MYIELNKVSKYYGEGANRHKVLDSVCASIEKSKICIIVGPSGSGKSTFLNCIGGLETIDEGTALVNGVELTDMSGAALSSYRREQLGFVFQFFNLIPNLTVSENIDVGRYLSKNPLNKSDLLKLLEIEHKKDCFPNELSGGEQQRCAIARALVKNPQILLCDEPTGSLDSKTAQEILCLLEKVNDVCGTTILMVTHNPAIIPMAHQVIEMHDGKMVKSYLNNKRVRAKDLEGI